MPGSMTEPTAADRLADWSPRLLLTRALAAAMPRLAFARLRALTYRLGGLDVGRGTLILGALDLGGGAGGAARLHIGAQCMINTPCFIDLTDEVRFEDDVNVGHHVSFVTSGAGPGALGRSAPILLKRGSWVSARATVLGGVTIGAGAVVAAGAVVTEDVAPDTLVGGIPARVIKVLPTEHVGRAPAGAARRS